MIYAVYVVLALVFFVLQLIMCFKAKKLIVRLIPVFMILTGYLIALMFANDILDSGSGFIDGGNLAGAIIAIGISCAAVCDAIAWLIYALICKKRKKWII